MGNSKTLSLEEFLAKLSPEVGNNTIWFNVDALRAYYAKDHPYLKLWPYVDPNYRIRVIYDAVKKWLARGVIVCLLEMFPQMVEFVSSEAKKDDLKIVVHNYHSDPSCMSYVWFFPDNVKLLDDQVFPLTSNGQHHEQPLSTVDKKTPEYLAWSLGEEFPKSFSSVVIEIGDRKYHFYAYHPGLRNEGRIAQTKMMRDIVLKQNPKYFVIGGDFNCMNFGTTSTDLNPEQLSVMTDVFKWPSKNIGCTFTGNPWDLAYKLSRDEFAKYQTLLKAGSEEFKSFCEEMASKYGLEGGSLDHVFCSHNLEVEVKSYGLVEDGHRLSDHDIVLVCL